MKRFHRCKYPFLAVSLVFLLMAFLVQGNSNEDKRKQAVSKVPQFVTAQPDPVTIEQPDGTRLTLKKTGDEVLHYTRTMDGYNVLRDEIGFYYYAVLADNGDLVISSRKASNPEKRLKKEVRFLGKIQKYLEYSDQQKEKLKEKWMMNRKREGISHPEFGPINDAFPTTGNRDMLVILGEFSDWSFVKTNTDFYNLMNVGTTSFKAYNQDNSYDALNVTTTVKGPYTINMTMAEADANIRSYIAQCVDAAENDGVDFSQFDNNNDGVMDALYVIHAGYGEEYIGAPSWYIWSHSWSLSTYARTYDGVIIDDYATSPELRNLSGTTITAIGVICHEFGHNLGAPDYYDTDGSGSGGTAWDLKYWDVMASGSWNDSGDTPAQHNMYTKWKFGWSTPTVISSTDTLSLRNTTDYNEAFRIDTTTSNEFFILENRQLTGWDAALPGHGMLIFHVDGDFIDNLTSNTVNANPSHQGMDLEEADDIRSSATYTGDPFPGASNNTSFTDTTTPNSKSWDNDNTNKPVTNISEATGIITFDFMGGANQPPPAPSDLKAKAFQTTVNLTWTDNASNEDGFKIYRGDSPSTLELIDTIGVDSTSYPDSGLNRKTYYYYKVCAYNTYGEGCSDTIETKTK